MSRRQHAIGTLSYGLARLASVLPQIHYHRYALLVIPASSMPKMPTGYEVRTAKPSEVEGQIDASSDTIAYRFSQGAVPLGAWHGGQLVGVIWLVEEAFDEDEVRVRWLPPPRHAWDTGLWIAPERRLSRAFAALWAGCAHWLQSRGLVGTASRIADYNVPSLAPHLRMGGRVIGHAIIAGAGSTQFCPLGDKAFTRRERPTIDLAQL